MRRYLYASVLAVACTRPAASRSVDNVVPPAADSIVLERTQCFGPCPVYRLRIDSRGRALFSSPDPKGHGTRAADHLDAWVPDTVAAHARRIGFAELPAEIRTSDELCRYKFTDHPGIILTIYGAQVKRVRYDTGCYVGASMDERTVAPPLVALKALAVRIDSLARTERWVLPHAIR